MGGAGLGRLLGHWLELVQGVADGTQFGAVVGAEVAAVRDFGDLPERGFVQVQAWVQPSSPGVPLASGLAPMPMV